METATIPQSFSKVTPCSLLPTSGAEFQRHPDTMSRPWGISPFLYQSSHKDSWKILWKLSLSTWKPYILELGESPHTVCSRWCAKRCQVNPGWSPRVQAVTQAVAEPPHSRGLRLRPQYQRVSGGPSAPTPAEPLLLTLPSKVTAGLWREKQSFMWTKTHAAV